MYDRKRSIMGKWKRVLIAAALTASVILALPVWNVGRAEATETDTSETDGNDSNEAGNGGSTGPRTSEKLDLNTNTTLHITRAATDQKGNINVALYKVAGVEKIQGYDAYTLKSLDSPFGNLDFTAALGQDESAEGSENALGMNVLYTKLAEEAAKAALGVKAENGKLTVNPVIDPINKDNLMVIGPNETKDITVPSGIYLVIAYGEDLKPAEYVGETTKDDGTKQLVTMAYSDGYVYSYQPELISVPCKGGNPSGSFSTADDGPWYYTVNISLKSEVKSEMASLEIEKIFETSDGALISGKDGCVYEVKAELNGRIVYSNAVAIKYSDEKHTYLFDKKIPVGATVTIEEVYDGAGFNKESDSDKTSPLGTVIIPSAKEDSGTNAGNKATFTNKSNGISTAGNIITNKFTPGQDGTYGWSNGQGGSDNTGGDNDNTSGDNNNTDEPTGQQ